MHTIHIFSTKYWKKRHLYVFFKTCTVVTKSRMFADSKITYTRIRFQNRMQHIEGMHSILLFWVFYKKIYKFVDGMIFFIAHMKKTSTLEKKRPH